MPSKHSEGVDNDQSPTPMQQWLDAVSSTESGESLEVSADEIVTIIHEGRAERSDILQTKLTPEPYTDVTFNQRG